MHTKDDTWYEMLWNPASLKPTKANAQLPSHCPKMGTKRQNNVKIEHKGKEFVLWAREMKDIRNHPWMLGWADVSRAHFVDEGGLSDRAARVNTARVWARRSNKGPGSVPVNSSVTGNKKDYVCQDRDRWPIRADRLPLTCCATEYPHNSSVV